MFLAERSLVYINADAAEWYDVRLFRVSLPNIIHNDGD